MQNLFQRSGVGDGAGGHASQTPEGGGAESANQIDEFRAVVEELRKENPGTTITVIRQMAIKKMTQDRLSGGATNAAGGPPAAHIAHQSPHSRRQSGHDSLAGSDGPGGRRRSYYSSGGSVDEQAHSILNAVRKVGQDAIKTIRHGGGALEEEIDDNQRVLIRRDSENFVLGDTAFDLGDVNSDESDCSSDETDNDEKEGGHAAESMRSIRSTRSIEAEKRAKKKKKKKSKKKGNVKPTHTTSGTQDASTSVRSRRHAGKCAATSMRSIDENFVDDDDCYDGANGVYGTRRGSNGSGGGAMAGDYYPRRRSSDGAGGGDGGDAARSDRSIDVAPGEFVCTWKHTRRRSTGSSFSGAGDSHGSGMSFDDSFGDGLICGFGTRRGSTSDNRDVEKDMKKLNLQGTTKGSTGAVAAAASTASGKKGAAKNPYLPF